MKKAKDIALTGVFGAIIFVMTFFVKIPIATGYAHLGDSMIYLCAGFIGGPWALLASVTGAVFADIIGGYIMYVPATVIIKSLVSLLFVFVYKNKGDKLLTPLSALMTVPAGLITVGGYFVADMIINKAYAITAIPGNAVQAVASAVVFIIIAFAFDRAKIKNKIGKR